MEPAAGTQKFTKKLLRRKFLDPEPFVDYKSGDEVNGFNLENDGFRKPIVVSNKAGLRMKVPPLNFTLHDVIKFTDPEILIDVIDVEFQSDMKIPLVEFVKRFYADPRSNVLNVLSFEYSRTNLAKIVRPPHVVKELSLVDNCWPEPLDEDDEFSPFSAGRPYVQNYCLMSMAGSYTDFHIDFGGSSVWYHVLWGEKIFYLTPPSKPYLEAFWVWNGLFDNRRVFFPNTRESPIPVARLHLRAGETILLPSGWIHAVYTPADSLVFGGNFLTLFNIPLQLNVYRMEVSQGTAERFRFPFFEKLHWYAAGVILGRLTNCLYAGQEPPLFLVKAASALVAPLLHWYKLRKALPKGERSYHLPARTYLQYAYPVLIRKLEESVQSLLSKSPTSQGKRRRRSASTEEEQSDSTDPGVSNTDSTEHNALFHARNPDDDDIDLTIVADEALNAIPEIRNSKLVNDHYFFPISDSEDKTKTKSSRKRKKTLKSPQGHQDSDPSWCTSPSVAFTKNKSTSSKTMPLAKTYPRPYNVSHPSRGHHSSHSHDRDVDAPPFQPPVNPPVRKKKTTARQRLAKRLGL